VNKRGGVLHIWARSQVYMAGKVRWDMWRAQWDLEIGDGVL